MDYFLAILFTWFVVFVYMVVVKKKSVGYTAQYFWDGCVDIVSTIFLVITVIFSACMTLIGFLVFFCVLPIQCIKEFIVKYWGKE